MIFSKISNPSVFQGNLRKRKYFEGWYYKLVSPDGKSVISLIPGISLSGNSHAFIQVIDGNTGLTDYNSFHINTFKSARDNFNISIEDNFFSDESISVNLSGENFRISGKVVFEKSVRWAGTLLNPGIMGWYSWVPFMECYHGVVSMDHGLRGEMKINDNPGDFTAGRGYIEKDWGRSFPECWVWVQANCFDSPGISFMFSVAKIPWLGKFFIGHIAFLHLNGKTYTFATWNGSDVNINKNSDNQILASLWGREGKLEIRTRSSVSGRLRAPVSGAMERHIKESVDADVNIRLTEKNGREVYSGSSSHAGLEVVGDIFRYFRK